MNNIIDNQTSDSYISSKTILPESKEKNEEINYFTYSDKSETDQYIYKFPNNYNILRDFVFIDETPENKATIESVKKFLSIFQNTLQKNRENIKSSTYLPPLVFRWLEDNSVLIEWLFNDFRIGFSIEPVFEDSGWYLVSNENLDELSFSGALKFNGLESRLLELLNFALINS